MRIEWVNGHRLATTVGQTIRPTDMEAMDRGETGNVDRNGAKIGDRSTGGSFPQRCVRVEGAARPRYGRGPQALACSENKGGQRLITSLRPAGRWPLPHRRWIVPLNINVNEASYSQVHDGILSNVTLLHLYRWLILLQCTPCLPAAD